MDGYFTDESPLRRVVGERAVALSAPRALLMQAAHPVAFAGFFAHTGSLAEPYERLRRTARILDLVGFGSRPQADRATARVRRIHAGVRGTLARPAGRFPAGTPYAADDPALLLWILATLADSAMLVYGRYVRSLEADERDALWQDYRLIGRLFGLADDDMPGDAVGLDSYVARMLAGGDLCVTPEARELAVEIVMRPPVPLWARGPVELVNQITVGLLPRELRAQYGFSWDPARAAAVRGGAVYLKHVVVPLLPDRLRVVGRPSVRRPGGGRTQPATPG